MTRCPTCGQRVESEREKRSMDAIAWALVALCFWGAALSVAEWTVAWWSERWLFVLAGIFLLAGAVYRLRRVRRQGRRDA